LAVVYDKRKFRAVGAEEKVVEYDREEVRPGDDDAREDEDEGEATEEDRARWRRGGTRQTKNIGLMVGLEFVDKPGKGLIVGTTHL
jgi:RNA exonuclease NGL2